MGNSMRASATPGRGEASESRLDLPAPFAPRTSRIPPASCRSCDSSAFFGNALLGRRAVPEHIAEAKALIHMVQQNSQQDRISGLVSVPDNDANCCKGAVCGPPPSGGVSGRSVAGALPPGSPLAIVSRTMRGAVVDFRINLRPELAWIKVHGDAGPGFTSRSTGYFRAGPLPHYSSSLR